ncbi:MAG: hypothetical protein DRN30_03320, partial [Thermoplasmata archaeon]
EDIFFEAYMALVEDIARYIRAMKVSVRNPREIILSGRLSMYNRLVKDLEDLVGDIAPIIRISGFKPSKAKHPAQGAAIIADGIAGGLRKNLIEHMKIKEASGTVVDYVILETWKERLKEASGLEW